jgi:cytochrome b
VGRVRRATITTVNKTKSATSGSLIWDLPTRLFHWLLALSLCASWITAEAGFDWTETHFLLGYCSLTLILFRLVWGVVGTTHARFKEFVRGPRTVLRSIPALFSRKPSTSAGHNPIGGWSTILFITLILTQVCTGLFISDDIFYAGPYNGTISSSLAGTLASVHHTNFMVLQAAVVLHIAAIAWYAVGKKSNLVKPMISGRKILSAADGSVSIGSSRLAKAIVIFVTAVLLVTLLVQLAPPPVVEDYF